MQEIDDDVFLITDLQQYVDAIEVITKIGYEQQPTNLFYRGMNDESYELLPSLFRRTKDGYHIYLSNPQMEQEIICSFMKESACFLKGYINDDDYRTWLTYGQHFNVPTRLLDWTGNSLVALYFAVCDQNTDVNSVVWILNTNLYSQYVGPQMDDNQIGQTLNEQIDNYSSCAFSNIKPSQYKFPLPFVPSYIDERMRAQISRFMIWGNDETPLNKLQNIYIITYNNWLQKQIIAPGYLIKSYPPGRFLFKIIISKVQKTKIRNQLDYCGINRKMLFPGLDSIGAYIKDFYDINRVE